MMPTAEPSAARFEWKHIEGDAVYLTLIQTDDSVAGAAGADGPPEVFEEGSYAYGGVRQFPDDAADALTLVSDGEVGGDGTVLLQVGSVDPYLPAMITCRVEEGIVRALGWTRGFFSIKLVPGGRTEDAFTYAYGPCEFLLVPTSGV